MEELGIVDESGSSAMPGPLPLEGMFISAPRVFLASFAVLAELSLPTLVVSELLLGLGSC